MATSTTTRVLRLLAVLLRRPTLVEELMGQFEISRRTVFRYIAAIRVAGFHVECDNGRYRAAPPE